MRFVHPEHPGRCVRLAYCLNLHPSEDLAGFRRGIESITLPLKQRLAPDVPFGVGLYLPAAVAVELAESSELDELARSFAAAGLDPFTHNAFPYGGFHKQGLKRAVFRPTWAEPERLQFTLAVARIAARLYAGQNTHLTAHSEAGHLSISTHPGGFGAEVSGADERGRVLQNFLQCVRELARIETETGFRIVLSIEAEPRASAGDSVELAQLQADLRQAAAGDAALLSACDRHLGTCLDACHAAVEFESPATAWSNSVAHAAPLGKLQFTSALRLEDPARNKVGRDALLALAEPVYLHQTNGRRRAVSPTAPEVLLQSQDLPELNELLNTPGEAEAWLSCDEWRCHFHVPVDLGVFEVEGSSAEAKAPQQNSAPSGLSTTRDQADELLSHALAQPESWGSSEFHLEIETYTWSVLPSHATPKTAAQTRAERLVDGLESEYQHVISKLSSEGWHLAS